MTAAPFIGKGVQKAAPKMIKESAEVISKGPDGIPNYFYDLVTVVKSKGTRESVPGMKRSDLGTKYTYKDVEVIEDAGGNVTVKKGKETPLYGSDEPAYHEIEMEVRKGGSSIKDEGLETQKMVDEPDEFFEATVRPDRDGKMKDVDFYIDDADHLELKEIADEINKEVIIKKASGGLAYALGE